LLVGVARTFATLLSASSRRNQLIKWVRTGENLVHQLLTFTAAQFSRHFEDRFCTPPMWSQQGRVCKRVQNLCIIGCLFSLSELFSNLRPL
jgi:hypothetical protein